jgi:endoglucanase
VPLYLAMAGQGGRADSVARFWRSYGDRPIPAWIDVQTGETAPYPLSGGGVAVKRRLLGESLSDPTPQPDYYASVLQALSHM